MRGGPVKRKQRVQHHWQHMILETSSGEVPWDGMNKLRGAFIKALPMTKRWAMSVDFQNNVSAALAREKKET